MKFNQYTWNLYKNSPEGKATILAFLDRNEWMDEIHLIQKYNPRQGERMDVEMACDIIEDFWCYKVSEYDLELNSLNEAELLYCEIIDSGLMIEKEVVLKPNDYEAMLEYIPFLSMELNRKYGEYFFPYMYVDEFHNLNRLSDAFNIEMPTIPKKADYKARCLYYWELCKVFYRFRTENGLSPDELSAFMYDCAPKLLHTEKSEAMPKPARAWFIGGLIEGYGKHWTTGFWQSNQETKRGDILVHYETAPISAITCMWIAQVDGVVDPFFHYYSNTYIGDRIDIPHVTLKELQADKYFSKHPLIRKKFQGVNGWALSGKDYAELLRMIKGKGFETGNLPKLYVPSLPSNMNIGNERDVEKHLLEPLLNSMGWYENKDFIRQLPIHAGRGHRVFPDYALHYENNPEEEKAYVLIEAKLYMKNNQDVESAFLQARSYAKLLESSVIVLCDKECLLVYEKKQGFNRNDYSKYYWEEIENPDKYNDLKRKMEKL